MNHIESLRAANADFYAHADYRVIVAELNRKSRRYALRALVNILPPMDLGLCIGEASHNLRSALDGLVYQLGVWNGASEEELTDTQFPIFLKQRVRGCKRPKTCKKKAPHFACGARRMIEPLHRDHKAAIERLQPYRRGYLGNRDPLYFLHQLNNADKHRLLQVVGGKAAGYAVGFWINDQSPPDYRISLRVTLEDGAKVGHVAAADVHGRRVEMEQRIAPYIAFWQGCEAIEGLGVAPTLSKMAERVSQIVETFAPDFS